MGFAGYVAVCVQLYYRAARNKQTTRKGKQTNTRKRYRKINEENRTTTKKHKWKRAKGNHMQVKPAKQIHSGI
jgi:dienelactone hydrolase